MIVFRPVKGEVILGKITSASEQGLKSTRFVHYESRRRYLTELTVGVEFFNDIHVLPTLLFDGCEL